MMGHEGREFKRALFQCNDIGDEVSTESGSDRVLNTTFVLAG
jgi:hypothetical protein